MMFVTMMRMMLMCGVFKKIMNWFKKKIMNWFKRDNELVVHKAHSIREMQLWPSACPSCPHSNPENGAFLLCKEKPILSHRKICCSFLERQLTYFVPETNIFFSNFF